MGNKSGAVCFPTLYGFSLSQDQGVFLVDIKESMLQTTWAGDMVEPVIWRRTEPKRPQAKDGDYGLHS